MKRPSMRYIAESFLRLVSRIIRDLPLLTNVKRLCIHHTTGVSEYTRITPIANEVGRLFKPSKKSRRSRAESDDAGQFLSNTDEHRRRLPSTGNLDLI